MTSKLLGCGEQLVRIGLQPIAEHGGNVYLIEQEDAPDER